MASDPFAATQYFHIVINAVLQEMFGIKGVTSGAPVSRKEGIFGFVNAYIGAVESQGRGTLHLHILLWLKGAPSSRIMVEVLLSAAFREKMKTFIRSNITADIDGACSDDIENMRKGTAVSYARPFHPLEPNYEVKRKARLTTVARTVQYHLCSMTTCIKKNKEGRPACKEKSVVPYVFRCMGSSNWRMGSQTTFT